MVNISRRRDIGDAAPCRELRLCSCGELLLEIRLCKEATKAAIAVTPGHLSYSAATYRENRSTYSRHPRAIGGEAGRADVGELPSCGIFSGRVVRGAAVA